MSAKYVTKGQYNVNAASKLKGQVPSPVFLSLRPLTKIQTIRSFFSAFETFEEV